MVAKNVTIDPHVEAEDGDQINDGNVTVSPAASTHSGQTVTVAMGVLPETPEGLREAGMAIGDMDTNALSDWLEGMGASKGMLETIQKRQLTGEEIMFCIEQAMLDVETKREVLKDLGMLGDTVLSMRVMKRVMKEIRMKAEQEMEAQKLKEVEERMARERMMEEMKVQAAEYELARVDKMIYLEELKAANAGKSNSGDDHTHLSSCDTRGPEGSKGDIEYAKVLVRMPETPKMQNKVDGISSEAWSKFGVGTVGFAGVKSARLGALYKMVFKDPKANYEEMLKDEPPEARRLDTAIFMHMNEKAMTNVMQFIGDIEKCCLDGEYSGLLACAIIGKVVDHRSAGKRVKMLEAVTKQEAILDARQLKDRLISFEAQLADCRKHQVMIGAEAIYLGLERMIEDLIGRRNLELQLAEVKYVLGAQKGNGEALQNALMEVASDLCELPAGKALPYNYSKNRNNNYHNSSHGAFVANSGRVCINFREYGRCRDGEACKYKHVAGEGVCDSTAFKETGFCDKYSTDCTHVHPWNSEKFGDKKAMVKKRQEENEAKRAAARAEGSKNHSRGQANSATESSIAGAMAEARNTTAEGPTCGEGDTHLSSQVAGDPSGEGKRTRKPKDYTLEAEAAEVIIQRVKDEEGMESSEPFSDLSIDADVTDSSKGTDDETETNEMIEQDGLMSGQSADYSPSEDMSGEESTLSDGSVESDGEIEVRKASLKRREELMVEMSRRGWTNKEIQDWQSMQDDMAEAFRRMDINDVGLAASVQTGGVEETPHTWLLYDSGTFRCLIGTGAKGLMVNVRPLTKAYPVDTASNGTMWVTHECDLMLRNQLLEGCLVNPSDMRDSLISEGWMAIFKYWEFHMSWRGKQVWDADGEMHWGYRKGVLFYMPASMLPDRASGLSELEMDIEQAEAEYQLLLEDEALGKSVEAGDDMEEGMAGAVTRSQQQAMESQEGSDDSTGTDAGEAGIVVEDTHLSPQVAGVPVTDQLSQEEQLLHEKTHKPKMGGCDICESTYLKAKPAVRSKVDTADYDTEYDNVNTDLVIFSETDANGNIGVYHTWTTKGKVGYAAGIKDKLSATQAKHGRIAKGWLQHKAREGGRRDYKVGTEKTDAGTEFKGAYKEANLIDEVWQTKGHPGRSQCNAQIENEHQHLEMEAAVLSAAGTVNDDQIVAVQGEAYMAAREILNHLERSKQQKEMGKSGMELLTGEEGTSKEWLLRKPHFLSLVYASIDRKDRRGKTTRRTVKALYGSEDLEVPGGIRVIPYKDEGEDGVSFYPTQVVVSYKLVPGRMPLLEMGNTGADDNDMNHSTQVVGVHANWEEEMEVEDCEDVLRGATRETVVSNSDENEGDDQDTAEYEAVKVLDELVHTDGTVEYQIMFKGYDEPCWVPESGTTGCKRLIREFETVRALQELGQSKKASSTGFSKLAAAVELSIKEELAGEDRELVLKAIEREEKQMLLRRLRKLSPAELTGLTQEDKRHAFYLRHLLTRRRPSLEQQEAGLKGEYKDRIVCVDLKSKNKMEPLEVHMGVPGKEALRLIAAEADLSKDTITQGDFMVAYLQGDEKPVGEEEIAVIKDPETDELNYFWMDGEVYGKQPAGRKFKTKVERVMSNNDMEEMSNVDSVYVSTTKFVQKLLEAGIKVDTEYVRRHAVAYIYVDDPMVWARGRNKAESKQIHGKVWEFIDENFDMKGEITELEVGEPADFLSMRMSVANDGKRVQLDNDYKISQILEKWNANGVKVRKQPFTRDHLKLLKEDADAGRVLDAEAAAEHRALIGDLNWIAQTTDPLLAPYVSIWGKYNSAPVEQCIQMREYVLGYLKGTIGKCLVAAPGDRSGTKYASDSDWAGLFNVDGDSRSRYGVMITHNGMPVAWKSGWMKPGTKDDAAIKMSSGEAEVAAAAEGVKLSKQVKYICQELGIGPVDEPIKLMVDASVAVAFADGTQVKSKMKHINLRWHWVKELKDKRVVMLEKIPGKVNLADVETKILSGPEFTKAERMLKGILEI